MAWQSDLLGLVRGLGKVSSASSRVAPLEASRVWEGSLAKPAVHNVVKLVLEERKSEELSQNKKAKGIPVSRLVENLPLVIDGVRVYLGAIAGISPSSPSSKGFPPGDVEREILGIDDASDEAEILGDELVAVVHDEHTTDVQFDVVLRLFVLEEVERSALGDVQQSL